MSVLIKDGLGRTLYTMSHDGIYKDMHGVEISKEVAESMTYDYYLHPEYGSVGFFKFISNLLRL